MLKTIVQNVISLHDMMKIIFFEFYYLIWLQEALFLLIGDAFVVSNFF